MKASEAVGDDTRVARYLDLHRSATALEQRIKEYNAMHARREKALRRELANQQGELAHLRKQLESTHL